MHVNPSPKRVLVTGAAGYIGSHTVLALERAGYAVAGIDNFQNSSPDIVRRLKEQLGCQFDFREIDLLDAKGLAVEVLRCRPDVIVHFAGLKSVEQSCRDPGAYYRNNLGGTLNLLEAVSQFGSSHLVFSSSATVYDAGQPSPVHESCRLKGSNPYGWTKLFAERLVADMALAHPPMRFLNLRYFNPVGADSSGFIGENPQGLPANLMPSLCDAAAGATSALTVFGSDYPTPDGTGVRDYIHVSDLADAHVLSVGLLLQGITAATINLGSGTGYSVLELVRTFERVNGVHVPLRFEGRRSGDVAAVYADVGLAKELLDWTPRRGLEQMCRDAWNWYKSAVISTRGRVESAGFGDA